MTPAEIKAARKRLGLYQCDLASLLGVHMRTVRRWEAGHCPISRPAALLLEGLLRDAALGRGIKRGIEGAVA